jgi:hypothetical protein
MLSDWQHRMLCIQIAKYGRTREPNEAARETSQMLPKVFAALYTDNITTSEVAQILSIPRSELEQVMFGLTIVSIEGSRTGSSKSGFADLKLIEKN